MELEKLYLSAAYLWIHTHMEAYFISGMLYVYYKKWPLVWKKKEKL